MIIRQAASATGPFVLSYIHDKTSRMAIAFLSFARRATLCASLLGATLVAASGQAQTAPVAPAAAGNVAKGKVLFLQCAACHSVAPGAPAKVGPNLSGVVGAAPGSRPGYAYSPAMKAASAKKWTEPRLDAFIANPRATVPGNKMTFGGVADPAKRRDLIAYLKSLPH